MDHSHPSDSKISEHAAKGAGPNRRLSLENFHLPPGAQRRLSRMSIVFQPEVWNFKQFGFMIFIFQAMFIIFYGVFIQYHPLVAMPTSFEQRDHSKHTVPVAVLVNGTVLTTKELKINGTVVHQTHNLVTEEAPHEAVKEKLEKHLLPDYYAMFQDVNVMMFIGFGLLMTFLKKYSHSAIGINFLLTAFVLQWYPILKAWWHLDDDNKFQYDITTMITSEFAAAAVLISMGAVLGNMSPEQYVIMAFGEVIFYVINEYVILDVLKVNDAGGSITIHIFGAYFGLTISKIIYEEGTVGNVKEAPNYHSDIFSVIGTIFLFMFWPSFNGAMTSGDQQYRCIINTFLSLAACCIVAFATSSLEERKFNMYHIQNCTLAGGVAVGSAANLIIHPFGAMIVGVCASVLCVSGFEWLTPWVSKKFRLHDTCGVNNLHGMPGLIAGIICAIASGCATYDIYGDSLYEIFPAMGSYAEPKRAAWAQALITFASIFISLGFAIVGAIITGFVLRLKFWTHVKVNDMYDDREFWRIVSTNLEVPSNIEVMKNIKQ